MKDCSSNETTVKKLSVIIVHFRTYEMTLNTVMSIVENTSGLAYEIILLDNASGDGSIEGLETALAGFVHQQLVRIIRNPVNGGFSYGNNIGIHLARGDILVLINPDIEIQGNILKGVDDFLRKKDLNCIVGPKIILKNGQLEPGCKRGFPTLKASARYFLKLDHGMVPKGEKPYRMDHHPENEVGEVDAISGAFMAIPRKVMDRIGCLDEQFFMYGEDLDLCYRAKSLGYRVVYNPELGTAVHYRGQSRRRKKWRALWEFYRAMRVFYHKHYAHEHPFLVRLGVDLGTYLLFIVKAFKNIFGYVE